MPPTPPPSGPVRPADVVNEEIRALMLRAGGHLKAEDRPLYERLRAEWAEAMRVEVVKAA